MKAHVASDQTSSTPSSVLEETDGTQGKSSTSATEDKTAGEPKTPVKVAAKPDPKKSVTKETALVSVTQQNNQNAEMMSGQFAGVPKPMTKAMNKMMPSKYGFLANSKHAFGVNQTPPSTPINATPIQEDNTN